MSNDGTAPPFGAVHIHGKKHIPSRMDRAIFEDAAAETINSFNSTPYGVPWCPTLGAGAACECK